MIEAVSRWVAGLPVAFLASFGLLAPARFGRVRPMLIPIPVRAARVRGHARIERRSFPF